MNSPFLVKAISALRPGAVFSLEGDSYDGLTWLDTEQTAPTQAEVEAKAVELEEHAQRMAYKEQRRFEYPPVIDYIDGVVKGDQAQIDAYIAACQAVKDKYPKPE